MTMVAWLLTRAAHVFFWLWEVLATFGGNVWDVVQHIFDRPLSWFLALVNPACTVAGDAVFGPLDGLPIWLGLLLLSLAAGALMLIVFRYASNQNAIGRIKDEMKADLLALKLFKDELRVTFLSQFRLLRSAARLQGYMLAPLAVMLVPTCLALAQMGLRYQWRPLQVGERANVMVTVGAQVDPSTVRLVACPGVNVEAGPVPAHVDGQEELVWRIQGSSPGTYRLRFHAAGAEEEKELVVDHRFTRVSAERQGRSWTAQLLHPAEPPLPVNSPFKAIKIGYGGRESWIYGADWWIVTFFLVSILGALILKPVLKVRF